ncbi:hypothetical protein [Halomonas sp. MES3-P3E]|uniref:hypothetical protein n=1 Tax=Halomonas sp. MES3-P3E TaxID=2058321 RepID=UPI0018E33E15|nr:hypothetical protein [Halomonas sp. MES3-P3E]
MPRVPRPPKTVGRRAYPCLDREGTSLVMHHDRRVEVSEAWVWLAAGRQLLNRLTHQV